MRRFFAQYAVLASAAGILASLIFACSSSTKMITYRTRLLSEADSLLHTGKFDSSKAIYEKIRSDKPNSEEGRTAHFALAYINVYYKNPNADWNEALKEFKSFASLHPKDPRLGEALSWIRMLTVIKSFNNEFRRASTQVKHLKLDRSENRHMQRLFLDSMTSMIRGCYQIRDSLVKKNAELENVIIDLEKKCQQAGR